MRPKAPKLATEGKLRRMVASKLALEWSPEQISGWLQRRFPGEVGMNVSHETIYRSLFIQARGVLKKELIEHLRFQRGVRRSKLASNRGQGRGQIPNAISIRERPAEAADRAVPGHWEGDLLAGSDNSYIATLVERKSRFVILIKVESKHTDVVIKALIRRVRQLPAQLRQSLTWDRGLEMARHADFSLATDLKVYFCDPQSPWQRGSNENTNGLLRQYFPKKTSLAGYSQSELNRVARRLNERPRETLDFQTPMDILSQTVATIG